MSGWGNTNVATAAPSFKILPQQKANGQVLFGNTTVGAFIPNQVVGVVDVNAANTLLTAYNGVSAGWNLVKYGTGQIKSVTVTTPGSGYANATDYVTFTSTSNSSVNATANIVTTASGNIANITNLVSPAGFTNTSTITTTITTVGGTLGVVAPVLGGRAGRVSFETLVAIGSIA